MFARFMIFFFGLCVLSLGIATVTNAGLGTGTVSSVAFVLNRLTDFSMGFFVFLTNVFFFVLQVIVDSKDLLKKALRQLPICFVFGMIFDIALWVSGHVVAQNYWQQLLMAFFGSMSADLFLLASAAVLSFLSLGTIVGIREGTLITAMCSGPIAKFFLKGWAKFFPKHSPID